MRLFRIYYQEPEWIPAGQVHIHPEMLGILEELGVVELHDGFVHQDSLRRLRKIIRLREFLGVNLNGAVIIADLLDRIERLEEEVARSKEMR